MSLEERAARAAEEERQEHAARRDAERQALREDILPHAIDFVQHALGITTSPDDWSMPDDVREQKCLTLSIDGVRLMVLRTYETDYTKERWSESSGEYYGNSLIYRGWVYNPTKPSWEQLTLASFGEAQQAQKAVKQQESPQHSGFGNLRDMARVMIAIVEERDDAYIHRIWDNADHLPMMSWAISLMVDLLRNQNIDPADYAKHLITYATQHEAAEKERV